MDLLHMLAAVHQRNNSRRLGLRTSAALEGHQIITIHYAGLI